MRVGVVSDLHGQPRALSQALEAMGAIDRLLCLGDTISEGRFCNTTVAKLRELDALTIVGNHEEAFFSGRARHAPGNDLGLLDWLRDQPTRIDTELGGRRMLLVHSTHWPSRHAYVPPGHPEFSRFGEADADIVLYGHTHRPVVERLDGVLIVNPGSAGEGRPTDNGFVRSCAVIDLDALRATIIDLVD